LSSKSAASLYADFHIHTTFSPDSQITPKTLVQRLIAHPLVKVAAVTDHGTVEGVNVVRQLAAPYPDLLIIPGVEITTPRGDVVLLGVEELPPRPWTPENVVAFAKQRGAVSVAVHPFREFGLGDYARKVAVDAVEVLNGGSSDAANREARELSKTLRLPQVGGSDAHRPEDLFCVYNKVQTSLDVAEVLAAIRKGLVVACLPYKSIHF
jgi:predicted metal-dependent phosphoesterase TrpH